nr:hypothetical protein [Tanacetum cinerariifolium]
MSPGIHLFTKSRYEFTEVNSSRVSRVSRAENVARGDGGDGGGDDRPPPYQ